MKFIFSILTILHLCSAFSIRDQLSKIKESFPSIIYSNFSTKNLDNFSVQIDCMPNSYSYNGTCLYFSTPNKKLSWTQAESFCAKLPLNASFLTIENEHHFDFIQSKLKKIKEEEQSEEDLIFYVGFKLEKSKFYSK